MNTCLECGGTAVRRQIVAEHREDLNGIIVTLKEGVIEEICEQCGDRTTEILDLDGLLRTVALVRALEPIKLNGADVRFMRRALDMTGKEFADSLQMAPEHLSRLENGVKGTGGSTDLLIRHNVCALLHEQVPAIAYDPKVFVGMRVIDPDRCEGPVPRFPYIFTRIRVKEKGGAVVEQAWDSELRAA